MMPGYGLGRDTDVIGGYSAYGFGILTLSIEEIITIVSDKIFKEIRECIIGPDNRIIKVELEV